MTHRLDIIRYSYSGLSGPGSDDNEGVLHIPQSSSITGVLPSDCLESYRGRLLQQSYPLAEAQSVYSTAPADWAMFSVCMGSSFVCISMKRKKKLCDENVCLRTSGKGIFQYKYEYYQ